MVKGAVMRESASSDFDLDAQVGRWRARQQRTSSLSPRELDELEDHLRARVNLEMELNAAITPARAFHMASHDMGPGAALSQEFTRAGKPRWKGLFVAGWAMFAASFVLPVTGLELLPEYRAYGRADGFEVFLRCLGTPSLVLAALPNLAMLMTIPVLSGRKLAGGRWLRRFLGLAGAGALGVGIILSLDHSAQMVSPYIRSLFGPGYWTWAASFVGVAAALHLRARGWASAVLKGAARTGAPENSRV